MDTPPNAPDGLREGGRRLWDAVVAEHDLEVPQLVQLEEACRAKDRADKLDEVLRGDADTWMKLAVDVRSDGSVYELRITNALGKATEQATLMKQMLAALRLPDPQTGKRPQYRGPRGAQKPTVAGGAGAKVTALDRARRRAGA
ncbi:hypothetical protein ACFJIY_07600 [Pimelobacter simplex]|uniref:hypothetical protein n=1 Tax=Nocardioides simplex TaxID=2045 RepID=UPI00367275A2